MLPTFIVAGAAKSGTTAIWNYLRTHPEICVSWMKEPNFFITSIPNARYQKGLAWYESLFRPTQSTKAIGDVSPSYMTCQESPQLIFQTLPKVQLLFIFRDPVERIYSQYRYALHRGLDLPSFEQFVGKRHPYLEQAIHNSSYHLHIKRYLDVFPEEQVLIWLYEDWRNDPVAFMRSIYQSLGVSTDYIAPDLGVRYNRTQIARFPRMQRLLGLTGRKVMSITMHPWLFSFLREVRSKLWQLNSVKNQPTSMSPALRQELVEEMAETISAIEKYLYRPLPAWREINS